MRIAVTGASGFIGRKVVEKLLKEDHKVYSYGRTDPKIENVEHVSDWKPNKKVNAIVHCAGRSDRWLGSEDLDTEFVATNNTLTHHALAINPKARFIFISSTSLYRQGAMDFVDSEELPEDHVSLLDAYSLSKAAGERIIDNTKDKKDYYILRSASVYGDGDKNLIPYFESLGHGLIILPGKKDAQSSFTNVDSLVETVSFFVNDYNGKHFGIYNVADKGSVSTHAFVTEILEKRGLTNKVIRTPYKFSYKSAEGVEKASKKKGSEPYLTRYQVTMMGGNNVVSTAKLENVMGRPLPETNYEDAENWK